MTNIDPRTAAYWPLAEQYDSVLPSDASGRVPTLEVPSGAGRPDVVEGTITGFGRLFDRTPGNTDALAVDDAGALRLTRSLTIAALARLEVDGRADGDLCTIIERGRGGGASPLTFGLKVEISSVATRECRLYLYWQTADGLTDVEDAGVTFTWPEPGKPEDDFLFLAATREVIGGLFAVRYAVNGEQADGEQDHALDCGGAASGDVSLGAGMSLSASEHGWDGVIDAVHVLDEAVSPEELQWIWGHLAVMQPGGVETARRMVPRGVYAQDPDSHVQRELAIEGMAIGHAKSLANRFRDFFLPDVAWDEMLERWERLTQHSPKPGDDIQKRRDRLLSFLGTVRGFSLSDVTEQLAEPFDLDSADVEILEYDNDYQSSDFVAEEKIRINGNGDWVPSGTVLDGDTVGAKDVRYGGSSNPRAMLWLVPLASGDDSWVAGRVSLQAYTGSGNDSLAGLVLGRRDTDEWVFIGVSPNSGTALNNISWFKFKGEVLDTSITNLQVDWDEVTTFLRVHVLGNGDMEVRWADTAPVADAAVPTVIAPGIGIPDWAGFCIASRDGDTSEAVHAEFGDLFTHTPKGGQRLSWWAYRDTGLPGSPDMDWARLVVQRLRPSHTFGGATTVTELLCDDSSNGCEEGPLGR